MKDHFIVGLLFQWLIIIHSNDIAINVILSMSRIIIISSLSSSHQFHPYRYIVNLVIIASNQSDKFTNTTVMVQSHIIIISKLHHQHPQAAHWPMLHRFHEWYRAIAPSAIIDTSKFLFSKEGQCIRLVDLIPHIIYFSTRASCFRDVMFSTHGIYLDTVRWQRQANSCSCWFHSTYRYCTGSTVTDTIVTVLPDTCTL